MKKRIFFSIVIFLISLMILGEIWVRVDKLAQPGMDRISHPYIMLGGFEVRGLFNQRGDPRELPEAFGYESHGFFKMPAFKFGSAIRSSSERGRFLYRERADLVEKPKQQDSVRVIILGGSVAYAEGASAPDKRWYIQLEKDLQKVSSKKIEVFSAANHSHVTTQERIIQDLYVLPHDPDVMVFLDGFNDANTGASATRPGDPYGQGIIYLRDTSAFYNFAVDLSKYSDLLRYFMQKDLMASWFPHWPTDAELDSQGKSVASVYYDNIGSMKHRCEVEKKLCFFFLQPTWDLTLANRGEKPLNEHDFVVRNYLEIMKQLNANKFLIDLTRIFDDKSEPVPFFDQAHFHDAGHEKIARVIADEMLKNSRFKQLAKSR